MLAHGGGKEASLLVESKLYDESWTPRFYLWKYYLSLLISASLFLLWHTLKIFHDFVTQQLNQINPKNDNVTILN